MPEAGEYGVLRGRIDHADRHKVSGWVVDEARPGEAVELELTLDGAVLGRFRANRHRPDLAEAGHGSGHHGFMVQMPAGLSLHEDRVLELCRAADGAPVLGSPVVLAREVLAGEAAARAIADAVEAAAVGADLPALEALLRRLVREVLARAPAPDPAHAALLERWGAEAVPVGTGRPRALVIDESIPDPRRDAGSSALLSHMRALRRLGFAVEFVPGFAMQAPDEAAQRLRDEGFLPWLAPWVGSVEEVLRRGGEEYALVYVHRLGVMLKYAALVRRWCPQARLVYCVADLHHLRAARQQAVAAGGVAEEDEALAGLRATEMAALRAADVPISHSPVERDLLAELLPGVAVHVVPWEVAVPEMHEAAGRSGVAFVGSFGHPPNRDAAFHLVEEVMPLVWAQDAGISLLLAGSDMPADLRAAAARAAGPVEVLGQVPALDALWARTLLSAAPLRFGAGIKGKVLDSLAAGIPCLCSGIAAEGMDFPLALHGLVQDEAADMARAILALHGDRAAAARLAAAGRDYIAERHPAAVIDAALALALGLRLAEDDATGRDFSA